MDTTIAAPSIDAAGGMHEIAASVAGERLWFRLGGRPPAAMRGEPFIAASLVPAMLRGGALIVDPGLPASPDFLEGARRYMNVFRFWGPGLGLDLRPVEIVAEEAPAPPPEPGRDTALFFSGGLDGMWSLLELGASVTQAVFVHGIDFQLDNPMARLAAERNREWLARHGVPLLEVESNIRFVGTRLGVRWNKHNGACLAGLGHLIGAATSVIASGFSWHFTGCNGTHLATDPLLSSSTRQIVHHGFGKPRWRKLEQIAREPGALDLLRVCWQDREYNCGQCEKCRRTMLLLDLLGLRSPAFPEARVSSLVPSRVDDPEGMHYLRQALELARLRGRRDVTRQIEATLRHQQWIETARHLDDAFLGGKARRLRQLLRRRR